MSKRIVLSVLATAAMSIGGWLAGGGSVPEAKDWLIRVELPQNCGVLAPRSSIADFAKDGNLALVHAGANELTVGCDDRIVQVTKQVVPGQKSLTLWPDELK